MSFEKGLPLEQWDTLKHFAMSCNQSEESYYEQKFAVSNFLCWIKSYAQQFGPGTEVHIKNIIVHGCPGSGKSYVGGYMYLAVISLGLRLMTTALMDTKANMLGGICFQCLFCLSHQRNKNAYCVAEIAWVKLHRLSNIKYLYFMLKIDVLIIDEIGQLSVQEIDTMDIILRNIFEMNIPFGGSICLVCLIFIHIYHLLLQLRLI